MIKLSQIINREQLLNLALKVVTLSEDKKEDRDAVNIIVWYIINALGREGVEATQDVIEERYSEMVASFITKQLVNKGYVEAVFSEDGEIIYRSTELGKQAVERALDDKEVDN